MPKFKKQIVLEIDNGYTVKPLVVDDKRVIAVGPEGRGQNVLLEAPDYTPVKICDGPGGTMSILRVPDTNHLVSIMGLFPPFKGQEGAVYMHSKVDSEKDLWQTKPIFQLPFAHRMEFLTNNGTSYLLVASVSKNKLNPKDWSQAGVVYGAEVPKDLNTPWNFTPILEGITRNHGMQCTQINGKECVLVSGAEGLFSISRTASGWQTSQQLDCEVSEVCYTRFNGDSHYSLATIEPFHGTKLCVYRSEDGGWKKCVESELSFGHGLWAGNFNGIPSIFVGNRAQGKELLHFVVDSKTYGLKKSVVEHDAGPTQIDVFEERGINYMVSSNQALGEVALYSL